MLMRLLHGLSQEQIFPGKCTLVSRSFFLQLSPFLSESFINLCMPNHLHFQEVEVPKKEKEKIIVMLVNLYLASSLGQL